MPVRPQAVYLRVILPGVAEASLKPFLCQDICGRWNCTQSDCTLRRSEGEGHAPVLTALTEIVQRRVATCPPRRPSPGLGRGGTETALEQKEA